MWARLSPELPSSHRNERNTHITRLTASTGDKSASGKAGTGDVLKSVAKNPHLPNLDIRRHDALGIPEFLRTFRAGFSEWYSVKH